MDLDNGLRLWNVHQQASLYYHRLSTKEKAYTAAGPVLSTMRRPSLHIATKDSSLTALHWSGYIALTLGLAYVLQVHPGFYSWMATAPTTLFSLCTMQ